MLINRNFRRLWGGQAISSLGDEVFDTTLLLWVGIILLAGKSYAPVVSTAVLVVTSTVTILLGPIAGVFVDRWDKRRTMLRTDLFRAALVSALLAVAIFVDRLPLPVTLAFIGVAVALQTAASQFFVPARMVLIRDVVPADQQGKANSYGATAQSLAGIVGPPLAAPLLVGIGISWAIAINAVSFVISYFAIRLVRVPASVEPVALPEKSEPGSVRREFFEGLRYMRTDRLVRALLVTAMVVNLGVGVVMSLDLYFVGENLHADPKWFGLLGGAFSVGAIAGAAVGGRIDVIFGAGGLVVVASGVYFWLAARGVRIVQPEAA